MKTAWAVAIRRIYKWLSGDLAYETYLTHWRSHHADGALQPLDRRDFYRDRTARKWKGVSRCC